MLTPLTGRAAVPWRRGGHLPRCAFPLKGKRERGRMKKPTGTTRDIWEYAMSCPLPPSSSYEFLQALRLEVVKYLNWVTHDLVLVQRNLALREIQRGADRLTRITAMIADAAEDHLEKYELEIAAKA